MEVIVVLEINIVVVSGSGAVAKLPVVETPLILPDVRKWHGSGAAVVGLVELADTSD